MKLSPLEYLHAVGALPIRPRLEETYKGLYHLIKGEPLMPAPNESVLTDGEVDLIKVDPYFISARDLYYYGLGERIAKDKVGRELMKNKNKV